MIGSADVICTTPNSEEVLFDGTTLKEGVHINAVGGYKPNMIEIDSNAIEQCSIFVDSKLAFYAGDLYYSFNVGAEDEELSGIMKLEGTKWWDIGQFVNDEIGVDGMKKKEAGKPVDVKYGKQRTLFKSVGVAAQDLHSAYFVYQNALRNGKGTDVKM